jgi:hypothetical protein
MVRQAPGLLRVRSGWRIPGGDWWVFALVCLWALPEMVGSWFGQAVGRWTQVGYVGAVAFAAIVDRLVYGSLWAPPLGLLVLLLFVYVVASAGVSFLVAAVAATPG